MFVVKDIQMSYPFVCMTCVIILTFNSFFQTCCQAAIQTFKTHIVLVIVLIVFSLGGAAIFNAVESNNEKEAIKAIEQEREQTLDTLW